jgi:hypothetical protein
MGQIQSSSGLKRMLLVGINYVDDKANALEGCHNDVRNMEKAMAKYYPKCSNKKILMDSGEKDVQAPSRANILAGLDWLTKGLKRGENVYFHFSGHGGLIPDYNGDEISGKDSCIYPISNGKIETISDDELKTYLVNKLPLGCKCFVVLDCCHSGSGLDLRYIFQAPSYGKLIVSQNEKYPKTRGSVIFLSGCRDDQTSADTVDINNIPSGALTNALLETWGTYGINIKFKHLLWDIREVLRKGKYTQIPQLSCSTSIDLSDVFNLM